MTRWFRAMIPVLTVLVLAGAAQAQIPTARVNGQVLDKNGEPYPDVTVTFSVPETGRALSTKTDKHGHFLQMGLRGGDYTVTVEKKEDNFRLVFNKYHVEISDKGQLIVNYKKILDAQAAQAAAGNAPAAGQAPPSTLPPPTQETKESAPPKGKKGDAEEEKKRAEEAKKFQDMKAHFDAGLASYQESEKLRAQLETTPNDSALREKLTQDCAIALTEFQQAEANANPANHAVVLTNLANAQECVGNYADAVDSLQKALALAPQASRYAALATDLAKNGKYDEATATCEKAIALDPTVTGMCWKNLGIVLSNAGMMKEAVTPLQKAIAANPKDPQAWYLFGSALAGEIDVKTQGGRSVYIIPPGTTDAYQKCIDFSPSPYTDTCKAALAGIQALNKR